MVEFKVGDKVERIDLPDMKGKVCIVTKISDEGQYIYYKEENGEDNDCNGHPEDFKLIKNCRKLTHLIIYKLTDKDPTIYCYGQKQMKEELNKLYDNEDVIQTSIKVYEIRKVFETRNNVSRKVFETRNNVSLKEVK